MNIGIVGLPNVGKSTLFKALTKKQVDIANYPFCTIAPNTGIVKVPDPRLEALADVSHSAQVIPASIEFVDIAGLVKGASAGEGLGNQFLAHIREVDAIAHVVRVFEGGDVVHVGGEPRPFDDLEVIHLELIFADLATLEKRMSALKSQLKSGTEKKTQELLSCCERIKTALDAGRLARTVEISDEEKKSVRELGLLTLKPFIIVLNTDESGVVPPLAQESLKHVLADTPHVALCAKIESELADLSGEDIAELGMSATGLDAFIRTTYDTLSLITYFTSGPKETRAWTIRQGTKAPQAAGVIHTDFESGFIRAEVIHWKDLVDSRGETGAKEKGLMRLEGKEYTVQDGDVMVFRFAS